MNGSVKAKALSSAEEPALKRTYVAPYPEDWDIWDFKTTVAIYTTDGKILLGPECDEKKVVRVLNHELLHAMIAEQCDDSTCLAFDNLCPREELIDKLGCPKL